MLPKDRLAARQRLAAKGGGHRTAFHWQDGMAIEGFGIGGTRQFDQRRHDVDQMPRLAHERAACLRRDPARPVRDQRRREPTLVSLVLIRVEGSVLPRSEEHTCELQSLMRNSYAVFCWKKHKHN